MIPKSCAMLLPFMIFTSPLWASENVKIGILNDEQCPPDNFNDHIYMAPTSPNQVASLCVLTFPRFDVYNEKRYMTEAIMVIDGSEVYLTLKKGPKTSAFMNADQTISVTVSSRETDTTCTKDIENCCGTNYSGSLTVRTPKGQTSIQIKYYRGG